MSFTQRFGLTYFGLGSSGSLFDDGSKFTGRDRRVIDRILAALESHDHTGGDRLEDPEFLPELTLSEEGGLLPAGTQFFYRVSFIDRYGLETAAGPEVSVLTPGAVQVPSTPRVEAESGGSLEEGLYWYGLSAISGGNETQISAPAAILVTDWRSVRVGAPQGLPAGTDEVSVWRQGPLDADLVRLATVPVTGDPTDEWNDVYTDDGSVTPEPWSPGNQPPEENLTNATNSVTIEIPVEYVEGATPVRRWRIYRTTASGEYSDASLVAEVVETTDEESGDLVSEFIDTGEEDLLPGSPLAQSQTLAPSIQLSGGGSGGGGGVGLAASGPLFIADDEGGKYRVVVEDDALNARSSGVASIPGDPVLEDEAGEFWLLRARQNFDLVDAGPVPYDGGDNRRGVSSIAPLPGDLAVFGLNGTASNSTSPSLGVMDLATREFTYLHDPDPGNAHPSKTVVRTVASTPDGAYVFVARDRAPTFEMFEVTAANELNLIDEVSPGFGGNGGRAVAAADGWVAFLHDDSSDVRVASYDGSGITPAVVEPFGTGAQGRDLAFSPNQERLAVIAEGTLAVFAFDPSTGDLTLVDDVAISDGYEVSWVGDDLLVATHDQRAHVYALGSALTLLDSTAETSTTADGAHGAMIYNGELYWGIALTTTDEFWRYPWDGEELGAREIVQPLGVGGSLGFRGAELIGDRLVLPMFQAGTGSNIAVGTATAYVYELDPAGVGVEASSTQDPGEAFYEYERGPFLPTADPLDLRQLTVSPTGELGIDSV